MCGVFLTYQHWQTQSQICSLILSLSGTIPPALWSDCDKEDTVKENTNAYISYGEISWRVSDNKQHLVALWAPRALNITLPAVQHSKKKTKNKTKQMRVGPGRALNSSCLCGLEAFCCSMFLFHRSARSSRTCFTQLSSRALRPPRTLTTGRPTLNESSADLHTTQRLNIPRHFWLSPSNICFMLPATSMHVVLISTDFPNL